MPATLWSGVHTVTQCLQAKETTDISFDAGKGKAAAPSESLRRKHLAMA